MEVIELLVNRQVRDWHAYVKSAKCDKNSEVPPAMIVEDVESQSKELVRVLGTAEVAVGGCIWVGEVSTSKRHVVSHVFSASQASWRSQGNYLNGRALCRLPPNDYQEQA